MVTPIAFYSNPEAKGNQISSLYRREPLLSPLLREVRRSFLAELDVENAVVEGPATMRQAGAANRAVLETCGAGFQSGVHWSFARAEASSVCAAAASRRGEHGARRNGAYEHPGEHVEGIVDAEVDPREGDEETREHQSRGE